MRNPITRPHTRAILAIGAITRQSRMFENNRARQRINRAPRTNRSQPRSPPNPAPRNRMRRRVSIAANPDIWPLTARSIRRKSFDVTRVAALVTSLETAQIAKRRHNRSRAHSRNRRHARNPSVRTRNPRTQSPLRGPVPRNFFRTRRSIQSAFPTRSWTLARPSR